MSDSGKEPKTKKSAGQQGLLTAKEWFKEGLVPLRDAVGINIKSEIFYSKEECEKVVSRTGARYWGLKVPASAKPVAMKYFRKWRAGFYYDVFRSSDCVPKRQWHEILPTEIDVLLATFTVNKSAKRFRDAASGQYEWGSHGLAKYSSKKKSHLYALKDRGILAAVRAGRLAFCGLRRNLAVYRGEGYCFHSTLVPEDAVSQGETGEEEAIFIESAPKGSGEGRLKDAEWTLSKLSQDETGFRKLPKPTKPKFTIPERPQKAQAERCSEDSDEDDESFDDDDWS